MKLPPTSPPQSLSIEYDNIGGLLGIYSCTAARGAVWSQARLSQAADAVGPLLVRCVLRACFPCTSYAPCLPFFSGCAARQAGSWFSSCAAQTPAGEARPRLCICANAQPFLSAWPSCAAGPPTCTESHRCPLKSVSLCISFQKDEWAFDGDLIQREQRGQGPLQPATVIYFLCFLDISVFFSPCMVFFYS